MEKKSLILSVLMIVAVRQHSIPITLAALFLTVKNLGLWVKHLIYNMESVSFDLIKSLLNNKCGG